LALLGEAVDVLSGSPARLEQTRALIELAGAFRRAGRRAEAQTALRAGLDQASRSGARRLADRAREELRAAGGRPRRERTSGPDALTASERRVARMAAEGLTNRQIAQALLVTVKTVEMHLAHAYANLDIHGREEELGDLLPVESSRRSAGSGSPDG